MRLLFFCFLVLLFGVSCIKEKSIEIDISSPTGDTCHLIKLVQGTDTVLNLFYDQKGRLVKLTDLDVPSNDIDSLIATFNSAGLVSSVHWDSPYPLDVFYDYSGTRIIKMKLIDPFRLADSAVYTFEYGAGTKPLRKNLYSYSSFTSGGLFEYYLFTYDSKGNISTKETFWAAGQLKETIVFTYTDQANSFRSLSYFSDPFNVFDMQNAIDAEACWNENDAASAIYTNANGDIIRQKKISYEKDSKGRVVTVKSETYYLAPGDGESFNYTFFYNCN